MGGGGRAKFTKVLRGGPDLIQYYRTSTVAVAKDMFYSCS